MRNRRAVVLALALAGGLCAAWVALPAAPAGHDRAGITVAAAASLSDAMQPLAVDFGRTSGVRVRLVTSSSGFLRLKIEGGADIDAFISAWPGEVDRLERKGYVVPSTRRDLLQNSLVCVVPKGLSVPVRYPADLLREDVRRIAIGDPEHNPAGIYAAQALEAAGLWTELRPKLVPCADVRAALAYAQCGTVQAAIVYRTDALVSRSTEVAFAFPADSHVEVTYPACVLSASRQPALAEAFLDFLQSEVAQSVFVKHGFRVVQRQR